MADTLKVYPSGFLGSTAVPQSKPDEARAPSDELFNRGLTKLPSRYLANEAVEELCAVAVSGLPDYKTFEFKERILKCALSAFGTHKLIDWLGTQVNSPHFTDLHCRWIEETLLYVLTSKPREMSHHSWRALLVTGGQVTSKVVFTPVVEKLLFSDTGSERCASGLCRKDMSIREFIQHWVGQSGGIDDLMSSLVVLFGKR